MTNTIQDLCAEAATRLRDECDAEKAEGNWVRMTIDQVLDVADLLERLAQYEPSDEELLALMPQQMCDDLAAASRALAEKAGTAPGVFRVLLNRHVLDFARIAMSTKS